MDCFAGGNDNNVKEKIVANNANWHKTDVPLCAAHVTKHVHMGQKPVIR